MQHIMTTTFDNILIYLHKTIHDMFYPTVEDSFLFIFRHFPQFESVV